MAVATPPSKPIEPVPFKKMTVAGFAGFVIPFFLGLLFELKTGRISDVATLESKPLAPWLAKSRGSRAGSVAINVTASSKKVSIRSVRT